MKLKLIPLLLGLGLTTSLSAATERMCFGQVPIEASTNLVAKITIAENEYFTTNKCKRYFSYYEKHVDFTQAECVANSEQLSLDKGYAPFPVFLRGTDSTGKDNIASYDWEIKDLATNTVLTSSTGFNAAHIFDQAGDYSATLTITGKDGASSTETKNITVWARDGKDYFVDSAIGDDRYNGLAQTPDSNCDANTASIGSCTGPWKTATRAFGEMSPYNVTNYPNGEYTADNICASTETVDIIRYKQGNFKIFRSSAFFESEALKDKVGNYLPAVPTKLCSTKVPTRNTNLRPGDQVLFNRGQQFNLETGVNNLRKYTATLSGTTYNYERLDTEAITAPGHWSKAIGVNFGAYGSGTNPAINNTGKQSKSAIHLKGLGMFGLSMSDLAFNLNSTTSNPLGTRAVFAQINGNPQKILFNNIDVKEMNQGILWSINSDAQGLFIFNSHFYDSTLVQIYTNPSAKDVAIINNTLDYSYNHLIYSSISHGLVYNNTLSRPAFGRMAFRLSGGDKLTNPNNYVWISDNKISGWEDPRTATEFGRAFSNKPRYNFTLVSIAPKNPRQDKSISHDIVFTRNTLSDAETLLALGAGENIKTHHNIFQSQAPITTSIDLHSEPSRPMRIASINNNKFIDTSGVQILSTFIKLNNYNGTKCTDQFNHKKINISNNSFYSENSLKRILVFPSLKQGKDLSGIDLPDLTLDQAKDFLDTEVTMNNNQLISANSNSPTIHIGRYSTSTNASELTPDTDWSQYFQSADGLFRLYNNPTQQSWASTDTMSIDNFLAASYGVTSAASPELTWDDIIAYAEENNISPSELEVIILNQVLASNPTYSMPSTDYSSDLPVFDAIGQWFSSIPSSIASLFAPEEAKWNDAKQLATTNKVSSNAVMVSMAK